MISRFETKGEVGFVVLCISILKIAVVVSGSLVVCYNGDFEQTQKQLSYMF